MSHTACNHGDRHTNGGQGRGNVQDLIQERGIGNNFAEATGNQNKGESDNRHEIKEDAFTLFFMCVTYC